jgi:AcrR family transcriptional regulator
MMKSARQLAMDHPVDKITFSDIAQLSGVHWTTVRRYFGSKEKLRDVLLDFQKDQPQTISDTKTKILESAAKVFQIYGYEGATLDQVAEEAGLTKGAVYWHFSSKSDLFLEMTTVSLRQLLVGLPEKLESVFLASNPQEAMTEFFLQQFKSCEGDKKDKPLLFLEFIAQRRDVQIKQRLDDSFSELFSMTAELIAQLQNRNLISKQKDPLALSITTHALINGAVLMWVVSPSSFSLSGLAQELVRVLWEGIQPE